jgi:hypothetical protein
MLNILDWVLEKGTKYSPLLKAGTAALSTYASFKDQQKKNQMQQAAYDDYMAQAEAAGHAARAAIDINYTPMTVSGVPTTKADVTDFTAVAAKGGLMSIPNKQRKRYARGPEEFEVQEMEEEVFSPGDFKMETGVDVLGEQVFYDTGKGDRSNAMQIWGNMDTPDKAIFDFDFEIFFMDGSWRDMIKSQVDVQKDTQMASAVDPMDALNDMSMNIYNKPLHQLNEEEYQMLIDMANDQASARPAQGIMQAAKGGRIGYAGGDVADYVPEEERKDADEAAEESGLSDIFQSSWPFMTWRPKETGRGMINELQDYKYGTEKGSQMSMEDAIDDLERRWDEAIEEGHDPGHGGEFDWLGIYSKEDIRKRVEQGWDIAKGPTADTGIATVAQGGRIGYQEGTRVADLDAVKDGYSELMFGKPVHELTPDELIELEIILKDKLGGPFGKKGNAPEGVMTAAQGGRIGYQSGGNGNRYRYLIDKVNKGIPLTPPEAKELQMLEITYADVDRDPSAHGGRIKKETGGIMDLGGLEKDYRTTGGFVPIGAYEKKDDVPARLSKNEFVMTADAVRAAGGGSINKGAQRMYDTMKHLEAQPTAKRMTA